MLGLAITKRLLLAAIAVSSASALLAGPSFGAVVHSANTSQSTAVGDSTNSTQSTLASEAAMANARLAKNVADPHAGTPERLTHPDADNATIDGTSLNAGANRASLAEPALPSATEPGLDVSSFQGNVSWNQVKAAGAAFAYVKSTEGTYYNSPYFAEQYNGSFTAGLIRGAYHFAIPNNSTGAAQADYFVANGGGWTPDGHTLPGMLDIEYNPYGSVCYGLTASQMIGWIDSFAAEYVQLTRHLPVIYTTTNWWETCTGNATGFTEGLVIANYGSTPFPLPASWSSYAIWQFADQGVFPGDQDLFVGTHQQLIEFASGPANLWTRFPGLANDIAVGADNSVWVVGTTTVPGGRGIYNWSGTGWTAVPGGAVSIAVGPDGAPWITNSAGKIYHRSGTRWVLFPGLASNIAVGANDTVWVVGTTTVPGGHRIYDWNGSGWTAVPGGAMTIAVGPGGSPWITNAAGAIYHRSGAGWVVFPGAANDIAVGADDAVWVVGTTTIPGGHGIYRWNGSGWTAVPSGAETIAVTSVGSPWITNSANQIYAG